VFVLKRRESQCHERQRLSRGAVVAVGVGTSCCYERQYPI